ncbi:hypothetical protein [Mycolicibacterium goodii]|nr:hypothetical protein [Mycolicibacterium goodii]
MSFTDLALAPTHHEGPTSTLFTDARIEAMQASCDFDFGGRIGIKLRK